MFLCQGAFERSLSKIYEQRKSMASDYIKPTCLRLYIEFKNVIKKVYVERNKYLYVFHRDRKSKVLKRRRYEYTHLYCI